MKHLFRNSDGEIVAADSAEQASQYHDVELGGLPLDADDWTQINDAKLLPGPATTAAEWASDFEKPSIFSTTYV